MPVAWRSDSAGGTPAEGAMLDPSVLVALRRVDAVLVSACRCLYEVLRSAPGEYHGLFISDQEFHDLLDRPFGESLLPATVPARPVSDADVRPPEGRWEQLTRTFSLGRLEQEALLLCLLPEADLKYDRIYAFLQDDVTAKRPTVDLLLNLLCPDLLERIAARRLFEPDRALARWGLLHIEPPAEAPDGLLRRTATVAQDLARWLLGSLDASAAEFPYWAGPGGAFELGVYPPEQQTLVERLVLGEPLPFWVHVQAQERWSAQALAQDLASQRQAPLVQLPLDALLADAAPILPAVRDAVRRALLTDAVLLVRLPAIADAPDEPRLVSGWDHLLRAAALTAVFDVPDGVVAPLPAPDGPPLFRLRLERPSYEARRLLWQRALGGVGLAPDADLAELASRYRLEGWQIAQAAQSARPAGREPVSFADLTAAAQGVSSVRLGDLALRIEPRHRWCDLVLPPDRLAQLREMCDQFRYRHIVYGAWGLGARSSRGQGLAALFAGPSGTGKTMAAEIVAADLALSLYRIDLSGVVSKYIGETEKNLERVFAAAREANVILLFDEADALFGKRSETKDAHDRYANIEISYLLQRIEEYDGLVILTSNLRQNLDEAFLRRLQFSIEFPFPEREARLLIWQRSVPPDMPLASDVAWEELAERYKLSGGGIRNALVTAAFLAAREAEPVGMRHLLWGVRREFQKLGKLVDESEFAPLRDGMVEGLSRR